MNFILGALLPVGQDLSPLPSCQMLPLYQLPFSANKLAPVLLFQTILGLRPLSAQLGHLPLEPTELLSLDAGHRPPLGTLLFL